MQPYISGHLTQSALQNLYLPGKLYIGTIYKAHSPVFQCYWTDCPQCDLIVSNTEETLNLNYRATAATAKSLKSCPTRLPRPWDSPGKNTGVGCHFLPQYMKVKSESEVSQSCPTLSDPMDCSLPGSSVHGIFQARVLEWGAIAFSDGAYLKLQK